MKLILVIIAAVCGIGWFLSWVGGRAIILYMLGKNYAPPTDEELKACVNAVILKTLHLI